MNERVLTLWYDQLGDTPYVITHRELGKGAFATVFLGYHSVLGYPGVCVCACSSLMRGVVMLTTFLSISRVSWDQMDFSEPETP